MDKNLLSRRKRAIARIMYAGDKSGFCKSGHTWEKTQVTHFFSKSSYCYFSEEEALSYKVRYIFSDESKVLWSYRRSFTHSCQTLKAKIRENID